MARVQVTGDETLIRVAIKKTTPEGEVREEVSPVEREYRK